MDEVERPPTCPAPGVIAPFDAGWNAHAVGLERRTVELLAADPGWALLGYDVRKQLVEQQRSAA